MFGKIFPRVKRKLSDKIFQLIEPQIDKAVNRHVKNMLLQNRRFQEHVKVRLDGIGLEHEFFKDSPRECQDRYELLALAIEQAGRVNGLWLEFGVSGGASVNFIAKKIGRTVYGFDSFEGLPEDWVKSRSNTQPKGSMSQNEQLPPSEANVQFVRGWFRDTLPRFLENHREPAAFVHIDSDLYSSAKCVLEKLRFQNGSVIVFDEYYNYPLWRDGEHKAFQEFLAARAFRSKCIGYCPFDKQAAFLLETS